MLTIPLLEVLVCCGRRSRGVSVCSPCSGLGFERQGTINLPSAISHVFISFPDVQDELSTPSCSGAAGLGHLGYLWHWHPSVLAQGPGVHGMDTRGPGQGKPQPPPPPDSLMALGMELQEEKASPEHCSACVHATDNPRAFSQLGLSQQIHSEHEASLASLICFLLFSSLS